MLKVYKMRPRSDTATGREYHDTKGYSLHSQTRLYGELLSLVIEGVD